MTRPVLAAIAICTAWAISAGNADARRAHAHNTRATTAASATGSRGGSGWSGSRNDGGDPIYGSCEYPWRYPGVGCPYGR